MARIQVGDVGFNLCLIVLLLCLLVSHGLTSSKSICVVLDIHVILMGA